MSRKNIVLGILQGILISTLFFAIKQFVICEDYFLWLILATISLVSILAINREFESDKINCIIIQDKDIINKMENKYD